MLFLVLVTRISMVCIVVMMNGVDRGEQTSYGFQVRVLRRPAVIIFLMATMLIGAGSYGFYNYITEFLQSYTGIETGSVSAVLFLFGIASLGGNYLADRLLTTHLRLLLMFVPV